MWRKLGAVALFSVLLQGCSKPALEVDALVYEPAKVVKPFKLKNQHGNDVGVDDLKSQWNLLFLGYTSCPDVCPMTLAQLRQVEKKLAIEDINVWFISVDPNRDTAQKRLQYINYFNPNYQAVSGPHKALYPFVQNLGLIYAVTEEQTGDYLVDHSASVALVDPHGKIRAIFKPEFKAGSVPTINTDTMIKDLKSILSYYGG